MHRRVFKTLQQDDLATGISLKGFGKLWYQKCCGWNNKLFENGYVKTDVRKTTLNLMSSLVYAKVS